jgi:hypothetical protein
LAEEVAPTFASTAAEAFAPDVFAGFSALAGLACGDAVPLAGAFADVGDFSATAVAGWAVGFLAVMRFLGAMVAIVGSRRIAGPAIKQATRRVRGGS